MIPFNQNAPYATFETSDIIAQYWSYVGTTTPCPLNKAAVIDIMSGGAFQSGGVTRAVLGAVPNYTMDAGFSDASANMCFPNNAAIAGQRKSTVGVLLQVTKGVSTTQLATGDMGRFRIRGRVLVTLNAFSDDAATGAALKIGDFVTLDGAAARLGGFRKAAAGEIIKGRLVATSAGAQTNATADVVAASGTGTGIIELWGDSVAVA